MNRKWLLALGVACAVLFFWKLKSGGDVAPLAGADQNAKPSKARSTPEDLAQPLAEGRSAAKESTLPGFPGTVKPRPAGMPPVDETTVFIKLRGLDGQGIPMVQTRLHTSFVMLPLGSDAQAYAAATLMRMTDEEGVLELELTGSPVVPGEVCIQLHNLKTSAMHLVESLDLVPGASHDLGDLRLLEWRECNPQPLAVGRVRSDRGAEVPNLYLRAQGDPVLGEGASLLQQSQAKWAPLRIPNQCFLQAGGNFQVFGPPGIVSLKLYAGATDYVEEVHRGVRVPAAGLEIRLGSNRLFRGLLRVPANLAEVSEYEVRLVQGGAFRTGRPLLDGAFELQGSSRTTRLHVIYPQSGVTVYRLPISPATTEVVDLGTIDILGQIQLVNVLVQTEDGKPLAGKELTLQVARKSHEYATYTTDAQGQMTCVLPADCRGVLIEGSDPRGVAKWTAVGSGNIVVVMNQ